MAPWPAKKDKGDPSQSPPPEETSEAPAAAESGDDADPLQQLTSHLCDMGQQLLEETKEQVTAYLLHRESPAKTGTSDDGTLAALGKKIDDLANRLARPPAAEPAAPEPAAIDPAALQALLRPLQEQLAQIDAKINTLAERLAPEQPEEPLAATLPGMADWQRALLGVDLAEQPGLDAYRPRLLEGVLQGDEGACALVGQLLTFRSAMTDKMPPLLKDLGEAYYRWQPKTRPGSDPMETAMVGWLRETMQEAGISNTIELVHPGERFDSARHNAATRGVEITEVRGWIVLRDNGKVYSKAAVAVQ